MEVINQEQNNTKQPIFYRVVLGLLMIEIFTILYLIFCLSGELEKQPPVDPFNVFFVVLPICLIVSIYGLTQKNSKRARKISAVILTISLIVGFSYLCLYMLGSGFE